MVKTTKNPVRKPHNNKSKKINKNKVKHFPLGDARPQVINALYTEFSNVYNNLKIIKNYTSNRSSRITGITVPHAGFEYSGFFAMMAISELLSPKDKQVYVLWFRHNPNSYTEHSYKNIELLIKKLFPTIIISKFFIDSTTQLNNLNIQDNIPIIVSTDFSHYNIPPPARDMREAWENDKQILLNGKLDMTSMKKTPCGAQPVRIFFDIMKKFKQDRVLLGYSNSQYKENWWHDYRDNMPFDGVTYAALASIKRRTDNFFSLLNSKMLSYSHLHCVKEYLETNRPFGNRLFWSPLKRMVGSCFVTVYSMDNNGKYHTYSCFGSWQPQTRGLLQNVENACNSVKKSSWGNHQPVSPTVLKTLGKYKLTITLIQPTEYWKDVTDTEIKKREKGRGYAYFNKESDTVGMTYLPSVWDMIPTKEEFFAGLKRKHSGPYGSVQGWRLYSYESITYSLIVN